MKSKLFALFAVPALFVVAGCSSTLEGRSQRLELGMSKEQAVRILGKRYRTVGAREDSVAGRTEVLRFEDPKSGDLLVYLREGRLVQWGDPRALDNIPQ